MSREKHLCICRCLSVLHDSVTGGYWRWLKQGPPYDITFCVPACVYVSTSAHVCFANGAFASVGGERDIPDWHWQYCTVFMTERLSGSFLTKILTDTKVQSRKSQNQNWDGFDQSWYHGANLVEGLRSAGELLLKKNNNEAIMRQTEFILLLSRNMIFLSQEVMKGRKGKIPEVKNGGQVMSRRQQK